MRFKNIFITLIVLGFAGYGALKLYVYHRARQNFQQILYCMGVPRMSQGASSSAPFDYDHISASVFGPIGIQGFSLLLPSINEKINIGKIILDYDYAGNLSSCPTPTHIRIAIHHLKMNASLLDKLKQQREAYNQEHDIQDDGVPDFVRRLGLGNLYQQSGDLTALGYSKLDMNITFDLAFDKANKQAIVQFDTTAKKMYDMNLMLTVTGVAQHIHGPGEGLKLKQARIDYIDASYAGRLYKLFAGEHQQDVKSYRNALIDGLDNDLKQYQIKLGADSVKNLKAFLADPKHLVVTMYPYEPVGLDNIKMYKPGDVPMLLNMQFYTN